MALFDSPMIGNFHFAINAFTGLDFLVSYLPRKIRAEYIGKRIANDLTRRGVDVSGKTITFSLPDGSIYQVVIERDGSAWVDLI